MKKKKQTPDKPLTKAQRVTKEFYRRARRCSARRLHNEFCRALCAYAAHPEIPSEIALPLREAVLLISMRLKSDSEACMAEALLDALQGEKADDLKELFPRFLEAKQLPDTKRRDKGPYFYDPNDFG